MKLPALEFKQVTGYPIEKQTKQFLTAFIKDIVETCDKVAKKKEMKPKNEFENDLDDLLNSFYETQQ